MQLFTSLLKKVQVVFSQTSSVHDHLRKVCDVLFYGVCHLFHRYHVVPIVLVVHTSCAYSLGALFAEVLHTFVRMDVARDHLHHRLSCLVYHWQDWEQLKVGSEKFRLTDIKDFLSTYGAAWLSFIVNDIVDAQGTKCVGTVWKNGGYSLFLIELLLTPVTRDYNAHWLSNLHVSKLFVRLSDNFVHFK